MALADPQRIEALDPLDPLQLDAELSEEERMVRDTARAYAEGELLPRVTSAFLDERFDREIMSEMGALGLLGATIDPGYGCAGAQPCQLMVLIARAVERDRFGLSLCNVRCRARLVMHPIHAYGSRRAAAEISAQDWQPGELGRLLRTDRTRCRVSDPGVDEAPTPKQIGGWLYPQRREDVDHQLADRRHRSVVWAKSEAQGGVDPRLHRSKRGMKGFSTPKIEGKMSLRASVTGEIVLDSDVFVPEENTPAPTCQGLPGPFGCLNKRALRHCMGRNGGSGSSVSTAHAQVPAATASSSVVRSPPTRSSQLKLANMQTEIALGLQAALARRSR